MSDGVTLDFNQRDSDTFGNPTSRLFFESFPTIATIAKRTISLTGIRNTFVLMHIVSRIPNSLWGKQARAAHASWILYGVNLRVITLRSVKKRYDYVLTLALENTKNYMGRSSFK